MDNRYIDFIIENEQSDLVKLLLSAHKYPGIDVPFAVRQIEARKKIKNKIPLWYDHPELIYPSALSVEQCSSQETASFKSSLVEDGVAITDLTGGLGVDSYFFSSLCSEVYYFEKDPALCEAARHNFKALKRDNIIVSNVEIKEHNIIDLIPDECEYVYLDPARRDNRGSRVFSPEECEPNVLLLCDILLKREKRVIVKLSPMLDIRALFDYFDNIKEVCVVAVENECKELLIFLDNDSDLVSEYDSTPILCANIKRGGKTEIICFTSSFENDLPPLYADLEKNDSSHPLYLYEPNKAILKGGAFKFAAYRYDLDKISKHSHLYLSNRVEKEFPGRIFKVDQILPFNKDTINKIKRSCPKANVSSKHFPLTSEELKERLGIQDGGDLYIFGTTTQSGKRILIVSSPVTDDMSLQG